MNRRLTCLLVVLMGLLALPNRAPAPLIYRPGEGWSYERPGAEGKWRRSRSKDQLEVGEKAHKEGKTSIAIKSCKRILKEWPLSDHAPRAQYLLGRCYEQEKKDEKAFQAYQKVIEKYPKVDNFDEVVARQFQIANRYLAGQWFRLWGYIPAYKSMEKTSDMYEKVIKNGPYSEVAPKAQMNIGTAREKQKDYSHAVKAYERAADRYSDNKQVSSDALYRAGLAYYRQAKTAEYDQSISAQAIATMTDFMTLFPDDPRMKDAQVIIAALKTEQARGYFEVARFYEKSQRPSGALVYYNEVVVTDPSSSMAIIARQRIEDLKKRQPKS